uniref:U84-Liphistoxin-Lsp1a_1 n=1 Tax=Liphistius sp. SGP-2016 TaxID=1905180 RepID=A0A4Q8K5Y4_9ARAC
MKVVVVFLLALVVVITAKPDSDCEKHRKSALEHETIMKLIPKCKDNGDYDDLQCYENSHFCVCYDPKGHAASPLSTTLKKCACHLRRHEKKQMKLDNPYLPQCDDDGSFSKKQCWDYNDSCWCVDENNKQIGDIVSDGSTLSCH